MCSTLQPRRGYELGGERRSEYEIWREVINSRLDDPADVPEVSRADNHVSSRIAMLPVVSST